MPEFTHLHVHTQYSLLDGAAPIDKLMAEVKKDGGTAVAITDHGNMFGVPKFVSEAKKKGLKPVVGCEFYLAHGSREDRMKRDGEGKGIEVARVGYGLAMFGFGLASKGYGLAIFRFGLAMFGYGVATFRFTVAMFRFTVAMFGYGLASIGYGVAIVGYGDAMLRFGVAIVGYGVAMFRFALAMFGYALGDTIFERVLAGDKCMIL